MPGYASLNTLYSGGVRPSSGGYDPDKDIASLLAIARQAPSGGAPRTISAGSGGMNAYSALMNLMRIAQGQQRLVQNAQKLANGGVKLTAKEREKLEQQTKLQQAQNAIYNNEEFRQRYQSAMQSSAAKAQQAVKDMREAYIKPTAAQFGVDAGKLSDIMMGQLSAETKQRVRDVKEDKLSYAGQKALHGLTNFFTTTLGNAIPFFRTEAEREAASKRAIEESKAIDQNNAYGRDQLLRQQEGEGFFDLGSGETGSYLANMAEMIGENAPAIAATLTPAGIVGAAGNALRLGAAGLNALRTGALMGVGAGVGAAMSSEGFRQRVFSDPNLSPEQQRAALESPEATANTALGAALGGIPFGAEGLWRMAAPRIPFTAAGRRVAADTAAQAAELTAARAAVPLAEREAVLDAGRRAALEAEAQRQAYQTMAPTFLSRAGQQARWMVPEVAAMNVGQTAGSNILYGGATGQDVPWTEGLGEAVASSIPLGLLGAGMSAASMGGRARTNFLRNFRDDGTPKITNAQLARTLNSRINNGTLGDVGTLDALRRFRADWGDEAAFADVLAQVDPQYHDMLGKVYDLLGKSNITAKDITAAFGRRKTPDAPVIQTGAPIEQRPQLPEGTGRAAQDVGFAGEAPRGFREERVRQRPEPEPTVINPRPREYPEEEVDLIAEAPEGYVQESLPVMRDGLPGGPDTALPPRYEGPIPAGPASRVYPLDARAAQTMLPEGSGAIVAESRSTGRGPIVAQRERFTTLPEPVGDGADSFTIHVAERAYDEGTTPRNQRAQQEQTAVANMRSHANQLTPLGQRILDYARAGDPSITAEGILDALIRDGRLEYGYEPRRIAAAYKEVMGVLDDLSNKNNHPRLRTYTTMKPNDRSLWTSIRNRMRSSMTTKKATADSPSRYRDEISLDTLQEMRNTLNEPKSPAGQSRTQGVGGDVTRREAAGTASNPATPGTVAPVTRDAGTQAPKPAAPADTGAGRANESGRPGGAETPNVGQGEVAVPPTEQARAQPVAEGANRGRGAEPAAEGTSAAGEGTGVTPVEGSGSENIQQPSQNAGDRESVKRQRQQAIQRFVEGLPDERLKELAQQVDEDLNLKGAERYVLHTDDDEGLAALREFFANRAAYSTAKKGVDAAIRRIVRGAMREAAAGTNEKVPTVDESARAGEQVRQEAEANPANVPPANRVDEPAAPVAETPKAPEAPEAPKVKIRRKGGKDPSAPTLGDGPFITKDELPEVARYIQKLPLNKLKQLARALDELDGQKGTETTSYTYTINKKSGGDKEVRKMLIEEAANADPRVSGVKEVHGVIKDFINGKISYPEEQPAPAAPKNEQKTAASVNKGTPENNMSALINKNQEQQAEAPTPEGSPRIIKIRDAYNALSVLRSERGLAGNRLNSELEKDLDLLFDATIKGTDSFSKVQKDRYEEITKALGGLRIDTQDMKAAIAYQASAAKDGMTVSNGQALAHIAGESNTTNNALNNKPQHVC